MELTQIKTFLNNPNPQNPMKAIVELRNNEFNSLELLFNFSSWGLEGNDLVVKLTSIANLERLKGTTYEQEAIDLLCEQSTAETVQIRVQVAKTLGAFDDPKAKAALVQLRSDSDYRVIAATLENLIR